MTTVIITSKLKRSSSISNSSFFLAFSSSWVLTPPSLNCFSKSLSSPIWMYHDISITKQQPQRYRNIINQTSLIQSLTRIKDNRMLSYLVSKVCFPIYIIFYLPTRRLLSLVVDSIWSSKSSYWPFRVNN